MTPARFEKHDCNIKESTEFVRKINYPELGTKMELDTKIYKKQLSPPFIVICDFESLLKPTNEKDLLQKHVLMHLDVK